MDTHENHPGKFSAEEQQRIFTRQMELLGELEEMDDSTVLLGTADEEIAQPDGLLLVCHSSSTQMLTPSIIITGASQKDITTILNEAAKSITEEQYDVQKILEWLSSNHTVVFGAIIGKSSQNSKPIIRLRFPSSFSSNEIKSLFKQAILGHQH